MLNKYRSFADMDGIPSADRPFFWYDLIGVKAKEFLPAYDGIRKMRTAIETKHELRLEVREFFGGHYVSVKDVTCTDSGSVKDISLAPANGNVARQGDEMRSLAAKVRSSLRASGGSADTVAMDTDTEAGQKRPVADEDDIESKKQRCSGKGNPALDQIAASLLTLLEDEDKHELPSQQLQHLAQEVVMSRCMSRDGTVTLSINVYQYSSYRATATSHVYRALGITYIVSPHLSFLQSCN